LFFYGGVLAGCFVDLFFICCFAEGFCRGVFYLLFWRLVLAGIFLQRGFFIFVLHRGFTEGFFHLYFAKGLSY